MTDLLKDLFMEDLAVGQVFESAERYELTEENIIRFAKEFDDHPFHTDPDAARTTFFKGLAGSGWMVLSITMRLINSSFRLAGGNIGIGGDISWPSPSRPGQILAASTTVLAVEPSRSDPLRGRVKFRTETSDQKWAGRGDHRRQSAVETKTGRR